MSRGPGHDYTSVCPFCKRIAFADKRGPQPTCRGTQYQPHTDTHMVPWDAFHSEPNRQPELQAEIDRTMASYMMSEEERVARTAAGTMPEPPKWPERA